MSTAHPLTAGAATLVVAWRTPKYVHGRAVRAGGTVIQELRRYAAQAAATIASHDGRPYDPDDEQGDAPYLTVEGDDLLDTGVVAILSEGASLQLADSDDLRRSIALYALLLGDDPDHRTAFIKRGNPVKLADKGLVAIFDRTLNRVTEPIFAFSPGFDVIVSDGSAWALDQRHFEALFKETDVVLARADEWVDQLSARLPIAEGSREEFAERLRNNSVLRRKIQSILRNPHLAQLTAPTLRRKMKVHGLDPDRLMRNGQLVFDRETERDLLQLLNEDLFKGDFSGEPYAASRKARRA